MNRLKQLRNEKGESITQVSNNIGIPYQTYRNYEIGKREPKKDVWQKIADYFDASVPFVMGFETSGNNNRLKELRTSFELSLGELSEELKRIGFKVGRTSLNNYENGLQQPKQETWEILANYFNVSVAYIMGLNTSQNKNEISISKQEYDRLKEIERKFNKIIDVIDTF